MDVNVRVTVDLGDRTMSLLDGFASYNKVMKDEGTADKILAKYEPEPAEETAEKSHIEEPIQMAKAEPEKRTRRTKEQIAAEEAATANGWDDMDDDAKLEAIKAEVTKHTKKGKSADIKFLLANFEANRASELSPDNYGDFYEAITRYGKGGKVEDIFPENLN